MRRWKSIGCDEENAKNLDEENFQIKLKQKSDDSFIFNDMS